MGSDLRMILAQMNFLVGDIEGNAEKIIAASAKARDEQKADAIIFPELAITGYPPEDLLLRPELYLRTGAAVQRIMTGVSDITIIFGYPRRYDGKIFNSASAVKSGEILATYDKHYLPNYDVFDEKRYFSPGTGTCVFTIKEVPVGLTICEDAWYPEPMAMAKKAGARIIININASPYHIEKQEERITVLQRRISEIRVPIVYLNLVGGQDELIFDGQSLVLDDSGKISLTTSPFVEGLFPVDFKISEAAITPLHGETLPSLPREKSVYEALVLGVRDYINKNRFKGAVIGVSGGIDSALTLAIASDALGSHRVEAVSMPSRYTSDMSIDDAEEEAKILGIEFSIIPIEESFKAFLNTLKDEFKGLNPDTTEENIQARCRGVILMAISNKKGKLVLTTGNKSEMSVGYATLYGDMAGGFCVLKDVPKTLVYRLAHYRNSISRVIPGRVIERPPTAELAPNQRDDDSLPPYEILDPILEMYIEEDKCIREIIKEGYDEATVKKVVRMVNMNEYKRRQAPPGVRITKRAFGKDRRYPITSGFALRNSGTGDSEEKKKSPVQ